MPVIEDLACSCVCFLDALYLVTMAFDMLINILSRKKNLMVFNDILHMSFLASTHVFKAYPAYTTTEI